MTSVQLHAFEAGGCIVQDRGGRHKGQRTVGFKTWGFPATGGIPGAGDHMVGATVGFLLVWVSMRWLL